MRYQRTINIPARRPPDQTKSLIVSTAWDLFRQLGARTTIADVAEKLKMSSANVYRYFPTKKALTDATCEMALGIVFEAIRTASLREPSPGKAVEAMLNVMHVVMRDQMINDARAHEIVEVAINERWPAIDAFHVKCATLIAEKIAQGQTDGEFGPGDPAALAIGAMTACVGIHHPSLIAQCLNKAPWPGPEAIIAFTMRALSNPNREPII